VVEVQVIAVEARSRDWPSYLFSPGSLPVTAMEAIKAAGDP